VSQDTAAPARKINADSYHYVTLDAITPQALVERVRSTPSGGGVGSRRVRQPLRLWTHPPSDSPRSYTHRVRIISRVGGNETRVILYLERNIVFRAFSATGRFVGGARGEERAPPAARGPCHALRCAETRRELFCTSEGTSLSERIMPPDVFCTAHAVKNLSPRAHVPTGYVSP
jgi:hypothetical protein